jgi:hypothetical protein
MSKTETPRTPAIAAEITGTRLVFTTATGETLTVEAAALSDEIREAAMMHGLKQKIGDAAALSRNPETGRSATIEDKYNAMIEVFTRLQAGQWNKTREAGEGGGAGGLLFKALCKVKADKTPAEIRAYLDGLTKEQQAAVRKVPAVAAAIEEIRAAQAKDGGIDGEALLAGF